MSSRFAMKFTELERDVLRWIVQNSDDEALVQQLLNAKPRSRKFTGCGSFTDLRVPPRSPKTRKRVYHEELPVIKSPELESIVGSVLFCEAGVAATLEFCVIGPGSFPQVLRSWELEPWPKQPTRPPGG